MRKINFVILLLFISFVFPKVIFAENIKDINNILKNSGIKSNPSQILQNTQKISDTQKVNKGTSKELTKIQDTTEMSFVNSHVASIPTLFSKPLPPAKALKNNSNSNLPVKSKRISLSPPSPAKQPARIKEDQPDPISEVNAIERDYYKLTDDTLQQNGPAILKRCEAIISSTFDGFTSDHIAKIFDFASRLHVRLIHGIPPSGNPDFVYPRIEYMQEMYWKLNYPNYRSWMGRNIHSILVGCWRYIDAMDWLVKVKEDVFDKITDYNEKTYILYNVGNTALKCPADKMDNAHFLLGKKYYEMTCNFMNNPANFPPDQVENAKKTRLLLFLNESSVLCERYKDYYPALYDLYEVYNATPESDNLHIQAKQRIDKLLQLIQIKITVKFKNKNMADWKAFDQPYKYGAAYPGETATFSFDINPSNVPADPNSVKWSGDVQGTGKEISVTFSKVGFNEITINLSDPLLQSTVKVKVVNRAKGMTKQEYALDNWMWTSTAMSHAIAGTDPNKLEPSIWAAEAYPGNQHNTIADAARHAYWGCLLTRYCDADYAKGLTDANEVHSSTDDTPLGESQEAVMDFHNNEMGINNISLHTHGPDGDNTCCRNAVKSAIEAGITIYLDDPEKSYNSLIQPTSYK